MTDNEIINFIIRKYWFCRIKSFWCFIFGHDKYYFNRSDRPHCARCELGPADDLEGVYWDIKRKQNANSVAQKQRT